MTWEDTWHELRDEMRSYFVEKTRCIYSTPNAKAMCPKHGLRGTIQSNRTSIHVKGDGWDVTADADFVGGEAELRRVEEAKRRGN